MYKCKKCGKKFKTDIPEVVDDNSNFTNEFKEKCKLAGLFFGSVRKIAYKVKKIQGLIFHIQPLKTGYFGYENPEKRKNRYSRYYIFDMGVN